jgi:cell division protein FtsB
LRTKKERNSSSFKKKIVIGGLGFLLFVLIIASFFGERGLIEIYRTKRKQEVLFERIQRLEARKAKLERDIEELKKNPKAYEKEAREKLGLVKEGEIIIIDKKDH